MSDITEQEIQSEQTSETSETEVAVFESPNSSDGLDEVKKQIQTLNMRIDSLVNSVLNQNQDDVEINEQTKNEYDDFEF